MLIQLKRLMKQVQQADTASYAAALAYNFLFALFPLLLFLAALLGTLHLPTVKLYLEGPDGVIIPASVRHLVLAVIADASRFRSPTLISVGALGFVWVMSGALRQLTDALNHAYGVTRKKRPFFRTLALSVGLGIILGVLIMAALAIGTIGVSLVRWLVATIWHDPLRPWGAEAIRWAALLALIWLCLTLIYNWLPSYRAPFRWLSPGAAAVGVLWILISAGFSLYSSHFSYYNRTYGSLGAVILLMLYLYVLSFALLLGGAINKLCLKDESPP